MGVIRLLASLVGAGVVVATGSVCLSVWLFSITTSVSFTTDWITISSGFCRLGVSPTLLVVFFPSKQVRYNISTKSKCSENDRILKIKGKPEEGIGDPSSSLWNSTNVQYPSWDDKAKYLPSGDLSKVKCQVCNKYEKHTKKHKPTTNPRKRGKKVYHAISVMAA